MELCRFPRHVLDVGSGYACGVSGPRSLFPGRIRDLVTNAMYDRLPSASRS